MVLLLTFYMLSVGGHCLLVVTTDQCLESWWLTNGSRRTSKHCPARCRLHQLASCCCSVAPFFPLSYYFTFMGISCVYICVWCPHRLEEGTGSSGVGVIDSCEPPCGFLGSAGPQEGQTVLLATELQLFLFKIFYFGCAAGPRPCRTSQCSAFEPHSSPPRQCFCLFV